MQSNSHYDSMLDLVLRFYLVCRKKFDYLKPQKLVSFLLKWLALPCSAIDVRIFHLLPNNKQALSFLILLLEYP